MKKRYARGGMTAVIAGIAIAMTPMVASAAEDTGWLSNTFCFFGTVDGVKVITINGPKSVTASEDPSAAGDIGLKIQYNGLLSPIKWHATDATRTSTSAITHFRVYHSHQLK